MNVIWNTETKLVEWDINCVSSSYRFSELKESILKTGRVRVSVSPRTATSVEISFSTGDKSNPTEFILAADDGVHSFLEKSCSNPFTGSVSRFYFRLTKRQRLEEMKEYILWGLTKLVGIDLPSLQVDLVLFQTTKHMIQY